MLYLQITVLVCNVYLFNFSLDIEGGEFQVMKTIPWDKVKL